MQPGQQMQPQVFVLNASSKRERGEVARLNNIKASKTVADIIRTTLGPRSMLKMILDPMGGIVMTNDGNAILREIDVSHPAAKSMIELARAQDEQAGDGTTSVIILSGEMIAAAEPLLTRGIHPIVITQGYQRALDFLLEQTKPLAFPVSPENREDMLTVIRNSLGTKFVNRWSDLMCELAYDAIRIVSRGYLVDKDPDIDLKRLCRIEKVPGDTLEDCQVLDGCVINKDVLHPKMRKRIENPRIVLLDCPLEYKKANSMLNVELMKGEGLEDVLKVEEAYIRMQVDKIMSFKPDLVITEKGVADLAIQLFVDQNVTVLRRVRKADNVRLAASCGAKIVNRVEELTEADVGTHAGLYELRKIGDEFFSYIYKCGEHGRACTILLRGAAKDTLMEVERNLQDALAVARNIMMDSTLVAGGGAFEMELSVLLSRQADQLVGREQLVFKAVAAALEVIPRTLLQNCGGNVIRRITELRAKHSAAEGRYFGVNGITGELEDTRVTKIWDPLSTKVQILKTALENACMLLRVDDLFNAKVGK